MFKKNTASSPAALGAELEELQRALAAKEAQARQLNEGLAAAELAGEEAIAEHEQKMNAADRQVRSLRAQILDLAQKREDAERRELHDGILARRKRAAENTARLPSEYAKMYDELRRHVELLTRAMHQQRENDEVNRLIREHRLDEIEPVPSVEHWRAEPAAPAVYEEASVEKDVEVPVAIAGSGGAGVFETGPGRRRMERRTVVERRLVSAEKFPFSPRPLWDCFAVPGLRREEETLIVPGSGARAWWASLFF